MKNEMKNEMKKPGGNTRHTVIDTGCWYKVECYEDGALVKTIDVSDHSYEYAEDTAENWNLRIIP